MSSAQLIDWITQTGINNLIWTTDLDESVLDMVKDANQVIAPAGLEDDFHRLDAATEGRFHPITGREMPYVDRIFPSKLKASTEYHSAMRWQVGGAVTELHKKPQWNALDPALDEIIAEFWPSDYVPRAKPFMRSIHYSHAPKLQDFTIKDEVGRLIQNALDRYEAKTGQKLIVIDGGSVFDIAPEGASKEYAMRDIIEHHQKRFPNRLLLPIYFGDSPGDLPAVPIVQAAGGKFVSVGSDPRVTKVADFQLDNPAQARQIVSIASRLPAMDKRYKDEPTPPYPVWGGPE